MKTINLILLLFSIIFLSQGCESNLPIDQKDQTPLISVNGILTQNMPGSVEITKSVSYNNTSDKVEIVENALVRLLANNNVVDTFNFREIVTNSSLNGKQVSRRYVSANNYLPEPGTHYKLQISVPGYDEITSSTLIPPPVQIISVDTNTTHIILSGYPQKVLECTVRIHDPVATKNYYKLKIDGGSNLVNNLTSLDDNLIYLKYNYDTPGFFSLEDEEEGVHWVSEVFTSDASFNGEIKDIKVFIFWGFVEIHGLTKAISKTNSLNIKLYSINEEYYKYSESYFKQLIKKNNIFSEPIMVYSNMSNGVGIFSGESVAIDSSIILP
jgi:hypothetical protein